MVIIVFNRAVGDNRVSGSRSSPLFLVATLGLFFWLISPMGSADAAEKVFAPVQQRLVADGFAESRIAQLYQDYPAGLQLKMIATMFRLQESRLNYDQFLDPPALNCALEFIRQHQAPLIQAERVYQVERFVIAALLLVETRFGEYTGRTPTLAVLSTYALMDQKAYRDKVWALLSAEDRERWGRQPFDEKLRKRSAWAYQELCALLRWGESQPHKVRSMQGSLMGAIGLPQFIPTTLERYAVDGNRDGKVDLFQTADAIFSVAHYLSSLGWSANTPPAEQERIIFEYNHSRPYVQTILGVAARLREISGQAAVRQSTASS